MTASGKRLGVGLGYRREIARRILRDCDRIDVVEVLADRLLRGDERQWEEIKDLSRIFRVVLHGVNLSIASTDCLADRRYLSALKRLVEYLGAPYYSDHFAFTKTRGGPIGHLTPVWRTRAQLETIVRNVDSVQSQIGRRLVLETITEPFEIPGACFSPAAFINEVVRRTGCGVLLDLTNVFFNAANAGTDARRFLDDLDMDAVVHIHLAGGLRDRAVWIDTHSRPIHPQVWNLFKKTAARCRNLRTVVIERDENFRDFRGLLHEVARARSLWRGRPTPTG